MTASELRVSWKLFARMLRLKTFRHTAIRWLHRVASRMVHIAPCVVLLLSVYSKCILLLWVLSGMFRLTARTSCLIGLATEETCLTCLAQKCLTLIWPVLMRRLLTPGQRQSMVSDAKFVRDVTRPSRIFVLHLVTVCRVVVTTLVPCLWS